MNPSISRREWLAGSATLAGAVSIGPRAQASAIPAPARISYALNTSTISGQKLTLDREFAVAAEAGYDGIEPWMRDMDKFVQAGGSLPDLGKRGRDKGLAVVDVIGFFEWAVDDDARRKKGLEEARRNMDLVRQLGGTRIAAPPFGATDQANLDLRKVADRYRVLIELGQNFGVTPLVEVWGFSKPISRLGEAAMVAIEAGHPSAAILADVYHLHKGGSDYAGLKLLSGDALPVIHMNDFPAKPVDQLNDADRVYPGDGVAPLAELAQTLRQVGFHGHLSLELFNREYWKLDPLVVARTGLEKMKAVFGT